MDVEVVVTEVFVLPSVWLADEALLAVTVPLRPSETLEEVLSVPAVTVVVVVAVPLVESAQQDTMVSGLAVFGDQSTATTSRRCVSGMCPVSACLATSGIRVQLCEYAVVMANRLQSIKFCQAISMLCRTIDSVHHLPILVC